MWHVHECLLQQTLSHPYPYLHVTTNLCRVLNNSEPSVHDKIILLSNRGDMFFLPDVLLVSISCGLTSIGSVFGRRRLGLI
jgi:hypothetical protein